MKCYDCGSVMLDKVGELEVHDDFVGAVKVYLDSYRECQECGELSYPAGAVSKIDLVIEEKTKALLGKIGLDRFMSAASVADYLEISRQGLNQHKRVRHVVFHIKHEGKIWYLRKSVELYKQTGDGRFCLADCQLKTTEQKTKVKVKYIVVEKIGIPQLPICSFESGLVDNTGMTNNYDDVVIKPKLIDQMRM